MAFHTIGYETSASDAALTAITPIPDGTLRVTGNDFLVPPGMGNVVCAAALINSATATLRAQLQSPSLRATLNFDISPINNGLVFGSLPRINHLWASPLKLVDTEPLDCFVQNGAAVMNRAFVWLADGPVSQTNGRIYTTRFTTGITLATATWANGTITFGQTLPAGNYQVVGLRVWSANSVAARLFFVGYPWRPGVPTLNAEDNNEWHQFRLGQTGVWGTFNNVVPPSLDVMGITDTAQTGFIDLIKVS